MLLRLQGGRHRVTDTAVARYLRRVLRDPHIETHQHLIHGSLVIGRWINKGGAIIDELEVIEDPSDAAQVRHAVERVCTRNSAAATQLTLELARDMCGRERRELRVEQDEADQHAEYVDWLRRRKTRAHKQDHPDWCLL